MLYHPREGTLTIEHTRMDYVCFGRGTRPLVLIPGLSLNRIRGTAALMALLYRKFAKQFRVYVFDRREDLPRDCTLRDLARDLALGMQALGLSHACVAGVSQGGMIAQYLALDHPELVDRLVLAVTLSRQNETMTRVVGRWIELAEQNDHRGITEDMLLTMYSEPFVRAYRRFVPVVAALSKPKDMGRFITLARACFTCHTYDDLPRIQCPVLVLGGQLDQIVTGEASEELAARLNCQLYLYEDLGHSIYYEAAGDFNRRVFRFFLEEPSEEVRP